jgi:hypothetical protein
MLNTSLARIQVFSLQVNAERQDRGGFCECPAVHAEQGRLMKIYYPSNKGAQICCICNTSLKKCKNIFKGGNAKFAG